MGVDLQVENLGLAEADQALAGPQRWQGTSFRIDTQLRSRSLLHGISLFFIWGELVFSNMVGV
jgi:hypothetical protein